MPDVSIQTDNPAEESISMSRSASSRSFEEYEMKISAIFGETKIRKHKRE
jgi:hypothetical protein